MRKREKERQLVTTEFVKEFLAEFRAERKSLGLMLECSSIVIPLPRSNGLAIKLVIGDKDFLENDE